MSGSYWGVGDKVNINQTDIEITAEGNDSFQENQVIGIYIPPSVRYFSGRDCTLDFDVLISYDTTGAAEPTKLCLDGQIGAQSLFSKCVVYAGNRQTVLETLNEYSSWVSVKYSYDTNDAIKSKRALTEGCGEWTPASRGTMGSTKSVQNNHMFSPYMEQPNKGQAPNTTLDENNTPDFVKASISMPIHMGCFSNSLKAHPNVLLDGCYVEFTCAANSRVFRMIDSTTKFRKAALNPIFHSRDGAGSQWTDANNVQTEFYTWPANNQSDVKHSPFSVGENVEFVNMSTGDAIESQGGAGVIVIDSIEVGTAAAPIKYTFADTGVDTTMAGGLHRFAVVSNAGEDVDTLPEYTISNCRMVVRQLDVKEPVDYEKGMIARMKNGGEIEFDIPSVACGLQSTVATDLQAVVNVPCEHAKARAIICMGTDSTPYSTPDAMDSNNTYLIDDLEPNPMTAASHRKENYSDRSGITGIGDYLTSYSFNIDGKIVPSRRIDTTLTAGKLFGLNQGHLIELEKALQQSHSTPPRCFADFRNNFLLGRALTLDEDTIYDGRDKDIRLLLSYESTAPDKNKLWKIFVSHIKTVTIKGDSINVAN